MICPVCLTNIPDDSVVCPACRSVLTEHHEEAHAQPNYCQNCGALVPDGLSACPACGAPVGEISHEKSVVEEILNDPHLTADLSPLRAQLEESMDVTQSMPRLATALPEEPEEVAVTAEDVHTPSTRWILVAALGALIVVGGITLAITHPWDPNFYDVRATTAADTSKAGYPGHMDQLSGQDKGAQTGEAVSGDELTYQALVAHHESLMGIREALEENEDYFDEVAFVGTMEEREAGRDRAAALAIELSNLIKEIQSVDVTSGTYAEDLNDVLTLGNWLRNYCDSLTEAWNRDVSYEEPWTMEDYICQPLSSSCNEDGRNTYMVMFDNNYESLAPEHK